MAVLSDNFLTRYTLGKSDEVLIRDSRLPGFALRVRRKADGKLARSWLVIHELPAGPDGRRRRRKVMIGDYPTFGADAARAEAQAMLQALKKGDDPRAARIAKQTAPTFEKLVEEFDRDHIATKRKGTQLDYRGRIRRHLTPALGRMKVADISRTDVEKMHRARRHHPTDANRNLAILSKMMTYAITRGWRESNPCVGIERYPEHVRDRWLDEHDLGPFTEALEKESGEYADLIRFLALTGWRVSEARLLQWDSVDLKRRRVVLEESKTGRSVRELSEDAAAIIEAVPHRIGFVFSRKRGAVALDYRTLRDVLRRVCEAAEIDEITPHALRHTAATWGAIDGATAHELKAAFGWKSLSMTERYVSKAESLARRGVERVASRIKIRRPSEES